MAMQAMDSAQAHPSIDANDATARFVTPER